MWVNALQTRQVAAEVEEVEEYEDQNVDNNFKKRIDFTFKFLIFFGS